MSLEAMRSYCESTYMAAMAASYPDVAVKFDNTQFLQPQTMWVDFCIIDGKSFACNMGTLKVDRHVGIVQMALLVPENAGTAVGNPVMDFSGKVFREQKVRLSDGAVVVFRTPSFHYGAMFSERGLRPESMLGFYPMVTRVPYWRDEPPQ
jgi:Bacteriophage related domain of unknown function